MEEAHTLFRWVQCAISVLRNWPQLRWCSTTHGLASPACLPVALMAACVPFFRPYPPGSRRDAKFSARLLMEQADKYIT